MEYPHSGKATVAASPGFHRLARWLTAVLLIFFGITSLYGLDRMYLQQVIGNGAGTTGRDWLEALDRWQVRGGVLVVAAVLLALLTRGLRTDTPRSWRRAWTGISALLMVAVSLTIWGPDFNSPWIPMLAISLSLLLFLVAVGLAGCTGVHGQAFGGVKEDFQRPGVFAIGVLSTLSLFAQVVLSVGADDALFGATPYLVSTVACAVLVVSLVAMVLHRHAEIGPLTRPAIALIVGLPGVMLLGNWCYLLSERQPAEVWLPFHQSVIVVAGELHLLGGGVLGALSLLVTLRARRRLMARVIVSPLKRGAVEA